MATVASVEGVASVELGAVFPQTEIGADAGALRAYGQAVEDLGFGHILAYDHVLGASAAAYDQKRLPGPYRERHSFHEPFVLFGFLAGVTRRLGFATGILISTQRQTVLVAKQAAEVDLMCGGRLRLGLGIGWNSVEYEGLGVPFADRAARQEEQIHLLRELWTKPIVSFEGRFHRVRDAGLNPLPLQRPIPIWLGGMAEPVLRRIGALADGWMPMFASLNNLFPEIMKDVYPDEAQRNAAPQAVVERVRRYAHEAGRDPAAIRMQGRLPYGDGNPETWKRTVEAWGALGADCVAFNTMDAGFKDVDAHIAALRQFKQAL